VAPRKWFCGNASSSRGSVVTLLAHGGERAKEKTAAKGHSSFVGETLPQDAPIQTQGGYVPPDEPDEWQKEDRQEDDTDDGQLTL
jgi:hypothetical protein